MTRGIRVTLLGLVASICIPGLRGIIDDRRAATPLNQSKLASSLEVSTPAVTRYIDLLVDLLLVRRLRVGGRAWNATGAGPKHALPESFALVRFNARVHGDCGLRRQHILDPFPCLA